MARDTFSVAIHKPDPKLIEQAKQIAANPGTDVPELQKQVATLAAALADVAAHSRDLETALRTIVKNVTFRK